MAVEKENPAANNPVLAQQDEKIKRQLGKIEHKIMVMSGKGGVGKSSITALLAAVARRNNLKVSVLDADMNGSCQAKLLGVNQTICF